MTDEERNKMIEMYHKQGVSVVGICSLLYVHGLEGIRHEDLRKVVFKELQRIDSRENKKV